MNNKVAFIICVLNESHFKTCMSCINDLEIPLGIEVDVISVRGTKSIAQAYNMALNQTDAKYKVYLHSNTYIISKNFIKDILDIFISNNQVGLIGVVGAKRLPANGLWWDDVGRVGEINILRNVTCDHNKLNNIIEKYEIVEAVDGLIMATQFDMKWKEEIFDGLYFYDISQCIEFKKKGVQVVVPRQEKTWCIHDWGNEVDSGFNNDNERYRNIFLKEYPFIRDRNIRKSEDLFDFNREEAMSVMIQNRKALEYHVYSMRINLLLGNYESVSKNAYEFAATASWYGYHPGFYQSPEIENMLLECADKLPSINYVRKDKNSKKRNVLHVLSEGYSIGGHTRLVKNWMKSDTDSIHSLITTWQMGSTPQWLLDEIKISGGWTFSLDTVSDKYIERALELRKLAYEWADVVVLHIHMMDPIPILAFGIDGGPPVIYMNHGDHCFWLGASVSDLVADLRPSGQKLTLARRSCNNSCILPIPLQAKKAFNKNEIRRKYNIKENETVILTIASNYKFKSVNSYNYCRIIKDIVNSVEDCIVYIVGPYDVGNWHELHVQTGGKVRPLGAFTEIEEFYQIADIYLDCFMMGSMTSLLDASKYGLPIIKFTNSHCPILVEFDEEFQECSYNNINDIIQEINNLKNGNSETYKKHKKVNDAIEKNHILDTQEKIKNIYSMLTTHKVNRKLVISNDTEDYDLFASLLINRGSIC
jgi:hypothetical protein